MPVMPQFGRKPPHLDHLLLLLIASLGLLLRLWGLGDKGLGYDEAATALMARASAAEILDFHWRAAFEHPPLWQLTMRAWSALFGQNETALRLLPALTGSLAVPLTWVWLRLLWPRARVLRLLAAALVAVSPTLIIYSQEARMYSLVVLLALLSLCLLAGVVYGSAPSARPRADWTMVGLFVLSNWLLLGYHYYSLLLVGCEALFLLLLLLRQRQWSLAPCWGGAVVASLLPIGLWMAFSPGFRDTFAAITDGIGQGGGPGALAFFDGLWRDLSFGALRWPPEQAVWGYLLLPLVLGGAAVVVAGGRGAPIPWGWLVVLAALLPLGLSVASFRTLAARYILFSLPAIYALAAAAIVWVAGLPKRWQVGVRTGRDARSPHAACGWWCTSLGMLGLLLALTPALLGLAYYFGPYQKSDYRAMAAFLRGHLAADEAIMLYGPRQHLLAKYYLGEDRTYYTAPQVELPPYWPVNAPPVVPEEMDGQIQELLASYPALWLVMTAQDEVDAGEFVPKYFTAVAYKQECWRWRDVDLCRFRSPHSLPTGEVSTPDLLYNGELRLQGAQAVLAEEAGLPTIYVQLDWLAERKPSVDYRVTLRLLDASGQVVTQRDDFPIGPLLPPTTWNAGDAKPGFLALPLPAELAALARTGDGDALREAYQLTVNVYDPDSGAPIGEPLRLVY